MGPKARTCKLQSTLRFLDSQSSRKKRCWSTPSPSSQGAKQNLRKKAGLAMEKAQNEDRNHDFPLFLPPPLHPRPLHPPRFRTDTLWGRRWKKLIQKYGWATFASYFTVRKILPEPSRCFPLKQPCAARERAKATARFIDQGTDPRGPGCNSKPPDTKSCDSSKRAAFLLSAHE